MTTKKATAELDKRVADLQEKAKQVAKGKPRPKNMMRLPRWSEVTRGVPNGVVRSPLFGAVKKGPRRYMEQERIAALNEWVGCLSSSVMSIAWLPCPLTLDNIFYRY